MEKFKKAFFIGRSETQSASEPCRQLAGDMLDNVLLRTFRIECW